MSSALGAALIGTGLGTGALIVVRALQPRPVPLARTLAAIHHPARPATSEGEEPQWTNSVWVRRVGRLGTRLVGLLGGRSSETLAEQLRILDKPIERHAYEKLLGATAGFALPVLLVAVMAAGGVTVSPVMAIGLAVGLGVGGFFYPDLTLAEQVEKRQQAFRHALSSWLDLVAIILAGGGGIETALAGAAEASDGWAFEEISRALRRAELTGRAPWDVLDDLGATLGIDELRDLAASVSLAGGSGAKIRQSLAAKADALRAQQAATIETEAESRTERMIVPVTVMVVGLTLFIGFGAVDAISTDGGGTFSTPTTGQ